MSQLPDRLRVGVARNFAAVKPLPAPWKRTLILTPIGLALVVGIPAYFGFRHDVPGLSPFVWIAISCLQFGIALWVIMLALRESTPGRQLAGKELAWIACGGFGAFVAGMAVMLSASLLPKMPRREMFFFRICFSEAFLIGVPALVVILVFAFRAFPVRPMLVGALAGLAIGLLVDDGWRLYCHVAAPKHVVLAHGGSVAALAVSGAILARLWSFFQRR